MNDLFNQVFGAIRDNARSGADTTGNVADQLISLGVGVAAITQILNGVATSADASPAMIRQAQDEMRYLQLQQQNRTNWIIPAALVGLFVYAVSRD